MVSITLAVPPEVKKKMDEFPEMNWSGFVRQRIIEKTDELTKVDAALSQYKKEAEFTSWALKLQRKSRKGRAAELRKKGLL